MTTLDLYKLGLLPDNTKKADTVPYKAELLRKLGFPQYIVDLKNGTIPDDGYVGGNLESGIVTDIDTRRHATGESRLDHILNKEVELPYDKGTVDPLLQLGLVDSLFGDNTILSAWNSNKQAEQNRREQQEYNKILLDMNKAEAKRANEEAESKAASELKLAEFKARQEQLPVINEELKKLCDIVVANKKGSVAEQDAWDQIELIRTEYPELKLSARPILEARLDALRNEKNATSEHQLYVSKLENSIPNSFKTTREKDAWLSEHVENNSELTDSEKKAIYERLKQINTVQDRTQEAVTSAKTAYTGKKVSESLTQNDIRKDATNAIAKNTAPSRLSDDVKKEIKKTHKWNNGSKKWEKK